MKTYIADCCHCDCMFETMDEVKIHNQLLLPNGGTHTVRNLGFNGFGESGKSLSAKTERNGKK